MNAQSFVQSVRGLLTRHRPRIERVICSEPVIPERFLPLPSPTPCSAFNIDAVIVIDVSGSMAGVDYPPSRLLAAEDAALEFLNQRSEACECNRIAVVGFGSIALPVCPLTPCSESARIAEAIRSLQLQSLTNFTSGLSAAGILFRQTLNNSAALEILFLSDGGHNSGSDPEALASALKASGVCIRTVGIGGSPRSVDEPLMRRIASLDASGQPLYRFIADRSSLVQYFGQVGRITK